MADGTRTTDLPLRTTVDEVVGNKDSGAGSETVRITSASLATQLIGSDMSTVMSTWLLTLPTSPTALGSGVWWNNSGIPTRTP